MSAPAIKLKKLRGALVAELQEEFGDDVIIRLMEVRGGERVTIPASNMLTKPDAENHWIVQAVGRDQAIRIAKFFEVSGGGNSKMAGVEIALPTLTTTVEAGGFSYQPRVVELLRAGLSVPEIHRRTGISQRTIYRQKRALRNGAARA